MNAIEAQEQARELISQSQLHEAKAILFKAKDAGYESFEIDFLLAQIFNKQNEIGSSLKHLDKAIQQNRFDSQLRKLEKIEQKKVKGNYGQSLKHPDEWAFQFTRYLKSGELLWGSSIILLVGAFFFAFKKRKRAYISFSLVALCLALSFWTLNSKKIQILESPHALLSNPIESSEIIEELPAGTRIHIIRDKKIFLEVERPGTFRGWIQVNKESKTL